jgi:RNA polymerase sigma-70 factor (ECF subfamily)
VFRTTVWTELTEAGNRKTQAGEAFVSRYRPPLLAFLVRRGLSADDAEDVAQEVFLRLFDSDLLLEADRTKGRFRSYLLGVTNNVVRERQRRERALKRGGGAAHVSLQDLGHDLADQSGAVDFEGCWISHLVTRALEEVGKEHPRQHELLVLASSGDVSPKDMAERLGRKPGQVRVDLHRARKRLAKHIRTEVARYCSTEEEYEDELRSILGHVGEE